jgi:putative hydrolase of the HAD superfamily
VTAYAVLPGVIFDALGTLYHPTPPHIIFSRVLTGLGRELGEREAAAALDRANRWWVSTGRPQGRDTAEELAERRRYVALALEDLGLPPEGPLADSVVEEAYWARWARAYADAAPALERLASVARLAVLSNGGPSSLDAVRHAGLGECFGEMYAGLELGVQKPEPEAYAAVARRLGLPPGRCWMVDDTGENVVGAEAAGMRGVLLDRERGRPDWPRLRIASLAELPALLRAG